MAAGCGGSSKSAANTAPETTTQATTTVAQATTAAETTTAAATTTAPAATTTTSTTSTSGSLSFANTKNCAKLYGVGQEFAKAFAAAGAKNDYQAEAKLFDAFVDQTPHEIRADVKVLAKAFHSLADVLSKVNLQAGKTPTPQQLAEQQKVSKSFDTTAVKNANAHIQAWAQKNCRR